VTFEIPGLLKHTKRETSREDKLTNKVQRPVAETKHIGGRLDMGKLLKHLVVVGYTGNLPRD
jgi:hypothetical protein